MTRAGFINGFVRWSRHCGVAAGLVLCSGVMTAPAMAASITYTFTGDVTQVSAQLEPQFTRPSTMSGSMTVDMTDRDPFNQVRGSYSVQNFTITFSGGYTATLGSSGGVSTVDGQVRNGQPDGLQVFLARPNGAPVNSHDLAAVRLDLVGPNTVWNSDALPRTVPSLSSFTTLNEFELLFAPSGSNRVIGVLTSLTAVPLPASVVLFGVGLIALLGLGAGKLRNNWLPQV